MGFRFGILILLFALVSCTTYETVTPVPTADRSELVQRPSPTSTRDQPSNQAPTATPTMVTRPADPGAAQIGMIAASDPLTVGEPVEMRVVARGLEGLYGIQLRCTFDPALVEISDADANLPGLQVKPGSAFPNEASFVALNQVDEQEGRIRYAVTLLGSVRSLQGEAEILSFELTPTRAGELTFEFTEMILADRGGNVLPAAYEGITFVVGS